MRRHFHILIMFLLHFKLKKCKKMNDFEKNLKLETTCICNVKPHLMIFMVGISALRQKKRQAYRQEIYKSDPITVLLAAVEVALRA